MSTTQRDYCDAEGARRLGQMIQDYWAKRGRVVRIEYVEGPFTPQMRSARVDVRSNMKNGLPPRATAILSRTPMALADAARAKLNTPILP